MACTVGPNININGLTLSLDVTSQRSFPGEPTTNLAYDYSTLMGNGLLRPFEGTAHSTASDVTGDAGVPRPAFEGLKVWKISVTSPSNYSRTNMNFNMLTELNGFDKTYTLTQYVYLPSGRTFGESRYSSVYQNSTGTDWHGTQGYNTTYNYWGAGTIVTSKTEADLSIIDQWQPVIITFQPLSSYEFDDFGDTGTGATLDNKYISFQVRPTITGVDGENWYFVSSLQIEEKDHSTPFIGGTRGTTVATNGGWIDLTGNGNNGDLTNMDFVSGGTLYFNGVDNYISLENTLTMTKESSTLIFIMKPYEIKNMSVFGNTTTTGYINMIEFRGNKFYCETNSNCNYFDSPTFTTFTANEYKMVSLVFDNQHSYWYINDSYIGETPSYGSIDCSTGVTYLYTDAIFNYVGSGSYGSVFHGEIPVILKYDTVLSSTEIQQMFNSYRIRYNL